MAQEQDGIWIIDADGKTSYANDRMADILGARPEDMVGQPVLVQREMECGRSPLTSIT